jgi:AbrB family looped-hinge helix DNA binding protein
MRITSKGQVTIPQEIREAAGFFPGTEVEFELADDGVVRLTHPPGFSPVARAIARLRGRAQAGRTTEEIMALTRGEE